MIVWFMAQLRGSRGLQHVPDSHTVAMYTCIRRHRTQAEHEAALILYYV
jgi:hypothetical protein